MPPRARRQAAKRRAINDESDGEGEGETVSPPQTTSTTKKRTGQACTRCRQRKIKCDENITGCKSCKDNGEVCEVRDRNTGQVVARGEHEDLQATVIRQEARIRDLEQRLKLHERLEPELRSDTPLQDGPPPKLPIPDHRRPGEAFLGTTGLAPLTVICGSKMTIYGNDFDLLDHFPSTKTNAMFELNDKEYNQHVQRLVVCNVPVRPTLDDANTYAHLFFTGISFFTPIVHRPAFHELLRIQYSREDIDPNPMHEVIFQMVCSIAQFQMAKRDVNGQKLAAEAKGRLLYSLTYVNDLLRSPDMAAMQALILLCMAMRNLQRPGPACHFCERILARAIDLGYHRKLDAFKSDGVQPHHSQMRQRLFWTIMVFHVNISGNLGRPMRLRCSDYDIEFPIESPDALPGEPSQDSCSWRYAPLGFKLTEIELEAYNTFRTVREPSNGGRLPKMCELNDDLRALEAQVPQVIPDAGNLLAYIVGLYLKLGVYATRLKLLHPANLPSHFSDERKQELLITCRQILEVAEILTQYHSLDTTIYYNMDFIHAIFIELYIAAQNAKKGLNVDLEALRESMNRWYWVLSELGRLLGTGYKLCKSIKHINENVMQRIDAILIFSEHNRTTLGQFHGGPDKVDLQHAHGQLDVAGVHDGGAQDFAGPSSQPYHGYQHYEHPPNPPNVDTHGLVQQVHPDDCVSPSSSIVYVQAMGANPTPDYYDERHPGAHTIMYPNQYQEWSNALNIQGEPAPISNFDTNLTDMDASYVMPTGWHDMWQHDQETALSARNHQSR